MLRFASFVLPECDTSWETVGGVLEEGERKAEQESLKPRI